jgi:hypothetical protein
LRFNDSEWVTNYFLWNRSAFCWRADVLECSLERTTLLIIELTTRVVSFPFQTIFVSSTRKRDSVLRDDPIHDSSTGSSSRTASDFLADEEKNLSSED